MNKISKCPQCGSDAQLCKGYPEEDNKVTIWVACFNCNCSLELTLSNNTKWNKQALSNMLIGLWGEIEL